MFSNPRGLLERKSHCTIKTLDNNGHCILKIHSLNKSTRSGSGDMAPTLMTEQVLLEVLLQFTFLSKAQQQPTGGSDL
jgi:hypothetical protein